MPIITESHPKWPIYSQLPKCGEITVSEDGVLFGLNCSRCPTIFSCLNVMEFLKHQHEHSVEQRKDVVKQEEPTQNARNSMKRKLYSEALDGDGDAENPTPRKSLRNTASHSIPSTSFVEIPLEVAASSGALKQEVDFDSTADDDNSEFCILNVEAIIDDPLHAADSNANSSFDRELNLESECVKEEEVCIEMAEASAESDSHSCGEAENELLTPKKKSKENSISKNTCVGLLALAEIYEHYSLLWDLDNDDNHNRTRYQETQSAMLQEINEKMHLNMTLTQLRGRIQLLRKYHADDKRKRLKAERYKIKFVPFKPLLYPKLQYLEPFVGPFHCERCNEKISQYVLFKAHKAAHDGQQQYQCSICQKDFKNLSLLLIHKRRHNGVKPHVCTICAASFIYAKELKTHQTIHTGEKQYICHICGTAYRTMQFLNKHKNRRHNPDRPRHQCSWCAKSFKEKDGLNGHMNTHLMVRDEVCPVCDKRFYVRKTLRQHMRIHDKEKRYQCDLCEKKFAQLAGLCTHRKLQHNIIKASKNNLTE